MPLENTLASSLLLAMPGMDDPNFARTAVLVCQHDGDGAMGVVLNRRTDVLLGELFEQLGIEGAPREMKGRQVLWGGLGRPTGVCRKDRSYDRSRRDEP